MLCDRDESPSKPGTHHGRERRMKRIRILSLLVVALAIFCLACDSESSDVDKANTTVLEIESAISACLADAGVSELDSPVVAWDGSSGKVTATSSDGVVYDAASNFSPDQQVRLSKATYDISQTGMIIGAHNISWKGVEFDASSNPLSPHWVKAP
jgi:hypothetical protein